MDVTAYKRLEKALETKRALVSMQITEETCNDLKLFSAILNEWVKDGKYAEGKIKLPEVNKKIVYKLTSPKYTFVKLTPI